MAERPNILFFHVDNLGFGEPKRAAGVVGQLGPGGVGADPE
jgi:hypothetical protein